MVEFDDVSLAFDGKEVLSGVRFEAPRGQTTVLLGRSGSGKTTCLRLVNRMLEPTSGRVLVDGTPTTDTDPIRLRRRTGYVLQEGGLLPHYTVARNVGLVCELEQWSPQRTRERVEELLALVGLPAGQFADRLPHRLSGGQRQRVGVARALAADPPLLLCDEPFGALDPITRAELQREFRHMKHRLGKTIVFVTHDVREALLLGDRIVLLRSGDVEIDTDPAGFRASDSDEVRAFMSSITLVEDGP